MLTATVSIYKTVPEHIGLFFRHVKFLEMRTEKISGAHFIYCQCACSQLMLQSSHMSLEKTCDDNDI